MAGEGEELDRAQALVKVLSNCLTEQQTPNQLDRAPPGFDRATESLGPSDTASLTFQAAGFWAWLAYFLATSQDADIKRRLSQLSVATLRYVATELSSVTVDDSLVSRIQHTFYASNRGALRRSESAWCVFPPRIL